MMACQKRRKRRKPRMWYKRQKEEQRYLSRKREQRELDILKTLIQRIQVQSLTQKDGYQSGRDLDIRNMLRRRDFT